MIKIKNLTKKYGNIYAIKDLTFEVQKGEIIGFLGPNGAGKSTTMNILTGYMPATSGEVEIDGFDVMDEPMEVKKRIGYLPEIPPLYLDMRVIEYLKFVAQLKKVPKKEVKAQINEVMEKLMITDVQRRKISNLSKGYKQRVGFAQALIGNPSVLVLDEPTVGLDPQQIIEIRELIKSLGEKHTVIFSSHILSEISEVCNRVIIIKEGEIVAIDTPSNLSNLISDNKENIRIVLESTREEGLRLLEKVEGVENVIVAEESEETITYNLECTPNIDVKKNIFAAISDANLTLREIGEVKTSLEDIFLKIINSNKKFKIEQPVKDENIEENNQDENNEFKNEVVEESSDVIEDNSESENEVIGENNETKEEVTEENNQDENEVAEENNDEQKEDKDDTNI